MSNLKPCPFCGGEARIDTECDMDGFGNFHKVECRECGASSKAHFASSGNECPQYYQEVQGDWNMRHGNIPAKLPDHVKQAVQAKMPLTLDQLWTAILEELGNE